MKANSFFLFLIVILVINCFSSCHKEAPKMDTFKDIEYKISSIMLKKDYKKALKYIDLMLFTKEKQLTSKQKLELTFKASEIHYLYLNSKTEAYADMKKLFKEIKGLDLKNQIKLLKYMLEISETLDTQNTLIFAQKLFELAPEKTHFYQLIEVIKGKKDIVLFKKLLESDTHLTKDEHLKLQFDLLLLEGAKEEELGLFIDQALTKLTTKEAKDDLRLKKLFYLEQAKDINYDAILKLLEAMETEKYRSLVKSKILFYKNKILLYKKK